MRPSLVTLAFPGGSAALELALRPMPTRRFRLIASCAMVVLSSCDSGAGRIDTACRSNADCADTQLCATGSCEGGLGSCVERPTDCPDTDNPVCGCDGRTYQNDCFADLAGVRLAQTGACVCQGNSECVEDQFCALDDSCDDQGTCVPRPDTCDPSDTQAVCGCDDMTYANECSAFQAGVRVSALGSCDCTTNAVVRPASIATRSPATDRVCARRDPRLVPHQRKQR
jgi:hypothetical protein